MQRLCWVHHLALPSAHVPQQGQHKVGNMRPTSHGSLQSSASRWSHVGQDLITPPSADTTLPQRSTPLQKTDAPGETIWTNTPCKSTGSKSHGGGRFSCWVTNRPLGKRRFLPPSFCPRYTKQSLLQGVQTMYHEVTSICSTQGYSEEIKALEVSTSPNISWQHQTLEFFLKHRGHALPSVTIYTKCFPLCDSS